MFHLKELWSKKWFKIVFFILLVIIVIAVALFGYVWAKLDKISYDSETGSQVVLDESGDLGELDEDYVVDVEGLEIFEEAPTIPDTDVNQSKDVINILLIGSDERTEEYNARSRADSMTIVSINKKLNTVRLVSLERGTGVPILEGEYAGEYDLLTHIFRWGGADLLVKTVEHCFKVDIDHYVRLNFESVTNIIDAIGGITIEITKREAYGLNEARDIGERAIEVKDGEVRMDGKVALRFARLRSIDSNWRRVERQRKVILAVVDELKDSSLTELNELADVVLPMIHTNMTKTDIANLILYAPNFFNSEFDQMTIPKAGTYGGMAIRNGSYARAIDFEVNNDLLYRFLYEGATSEELLAE